MAFYQKTIALLLKNNYFLFRNSNVALSHTNVSDNSTLSENEESSPDVSGLLSIRFQNDNITPEMYFDQQWHPICAHHFADNDFGAELFCRKFGKISFF